MHTNKIGKKGKIAAILAAVAVVLGGAFSPLTPTASADSTTANSLTELKAQISGASGERSITLGNDIAWDGQSIVIPAGKNITLYGDHTIFRDKNATTLNSMFDVKGTLTLGGKVKLSGKTGTCAPGQTSTPKVSGPFGGGTTPKVTEKIDKWWVKHPADEKYKAVENKNVILGFTDYDRADGNTVTAGVAYIGDDNVLHLKAASEVLELDANNRYQIKSGLNRGKYVFKVTGVDNDQYEAAWFNTTDGSGKVIGRDNMVVGALSAVMVLPAGDGNAHKIENSKVNLDVGGSTQNFKFSMSGGDLVTRKFIIPNTPQAQPQYADQIVAGAMGQVQDTRGGAYGKGTYLWVEHEDIYWTVEGTDQRFDSKNAADQWASANAVPQYWTVEGTDQRFGSQAAAQQWANQHATTTPGACTIDSTCSKITTAMFNGSKGNEKGFFVQVSGNGIFNLQGNAELSNFLTGPNVSYVAPVVAKGGTVNIKGGKIHDNSAGYNADDSKNQDSANKIEKYIEKNLARTETAGAVMYLGGAKGAITGGTIENNRGDTGGIVVDGENTAVTMTGGAINKNVGIHYGGAAYVHFGASFTMAGNATMSNNYAWDRGGAVYVSSQDYASSIVWPVIDPKEYKPAIFVMDENAVISGNYAVNRAGAVFVESHDVMLKSGQIMGNFSRSLGGAIYVVGDGDARMYQLYVPNACITGNTAVKSGVNAGPLNKALPNSTGDTCTVNNNLQSTGLLQGDNVAFKNHEGFGGGVWLCAFGGNATFGSGQDAQGNTADVVVAGNSAQPKQGADMHLRPTKPGAGSGINVLNNYSDDHWVNEVNNKQILVNQVYTGPLNVKNTGSAQCSGSLKIQGNYARVGGGIASDGTVVFGPAKDIYRVHGQLDVTKTWENVSEQDRKAIDLQLAVKDGDTTYPLEGYKVRLDGKADVFDNENELQENDGKYNNETPAWEATAWTGTFGLPLVYTDSAGATKPVFTFKDPDNASRTLNPAEPEDLPRLYELIKAKRLGTGNLTAKLTIIETINGQAPTEYVYDEEDVTLNVNSSATDSKTLAQKTYKDRAGNVIGVVNTNKLALNLHKNISNTIPDEEPTVEKYVNQKVHDELEFFDKEFTYDVMAYVPLDATKVTITDTLVEGLEFADANGKPTKAALGTIQRIAYRSTNDHTPGGSVSEAPEGTLTISNQTVGIANGNKLVVTIDKATPLNRIKGKWVQVTFKARIKDTYRTINALKAAGWATEDVNKQGAIPGPDASLVEALNATIAPNYDTVVRAIEGPSRLFALTQNGNYYATPMNDKSGNTWVAPSAGDDFTANAASRFNGTATNNMRELVLKATPSGQKANWPVQSDEAHEGMANKALYTVVSPRNGGEYETNTVTVKPETTEVKVAKRWNVNGSTAWPDDIQKVTFGVFDNTGKQITTVDLTKVEPTKTVTGLAKLQGVTYSAKEISVTTASGEVKNVSGTGDNGMVKISDLLSFIAKTIKEADTYVTLNEAPQVEKYVNNNVHADIVNFDQVFEYSVMAYVPQGATKVEITDTLSDDLLFVDYNGKVQGQDGFDATKLITNSTGLKKFDLIIESTNNHQVNGTVKGHSDINWFSNHPEQHLNGPLGRADGVALSNGGKTITVTVNENELKANGRQIDAHGKWIVLSFRAAINPDSYKNVAEQVKAGADPVAGSTLSWQKITDDKTVTGGSKPHAGLDNTAKYKVYVGNEGSSNYETNTVTVKPGTTSVTATKTWLDEKSDAMTWPSEVASVTVKVLRSDTDAEVGTITLTKANPKGTLKDLPKLDGVTYTVEEVAIPGYIEYGSVSGTGTVDDPYVFNNQKRGGPQIEKYINNGVHDNLDAGFDTSFKYDIIAYVPNDADEIVIKDKLVNALEFAKAPAGGTPSDDQTVAAEASTNPNEVVTSIVVKDDNNHQVGTKPAQYPNATVLQPGDDVRSKAKVAINGKELTVTFGSDSTPITAADGLRGKYIQITFWAKYTQQMIDAAQVGDSQTITGNGAIIGGMNSHTGTTNDASYDIRVGNDWEKDVKSNTVTVKGKDTQLEATKQWQNADGSAASWPDDVNEVKINVIKNGNKTDIADTIKLNADSAIGKSTKLPVLVGVTYTLDEVAVPGYITTRNGNTFINKAVGEPQIEKYINNGVHDNLDAGFDTSFKYDIMAYVPLDADSLEINDTLVAALEFAKAPDGGTLSNSQTVAAEHSTDPAEVVTGIVAKPSNDHTVGGTVVTADGAVMLGDAAVASIDGKHLKVEIANAEAYRGQWIQVTFWAKYTQEMINAAKVGNSDTITDNGTVLGGAARHDGTTNDATYKIKVRNDWSSEHKSNTVTVKGKSTQLGVKKAWNVDGSTAWPEGIDTVTFGIFKAEGDTTTPVMVDADGVIVSPNGEGGYPASAEQMTVVLNENKTSDTVSGLPVLVGVMYSAKEIAVNDRLVSGADDASVAAGLVSLSDVLDFVATTVKQTVSGVDWFTTTNEKPSIEKYINHDVDAHLVEFDKSFTYDILAYVPLSADSLVITDTLVPSLEFDTGNIFIESGDTGVNEAVTAIVAKASNNHTAGENGTVATTSDSDTSLYTPYVGGGAAVPKIRDDGRILTVTIDDATPYRGQWIQVTFKAKYTKDAIKAAQTSPPADSNDNEKITDNGTVISQIAEHDGTQNTASYKVKVGNDWTSEHKSNTVTHDAGTITVSAEKQWKHADGTPAEWPKDVAEVKVKVINDKTGEEVDEITLSAAAPRGTSRELQKLTGVTYSIKEVPVKGFTSTIDGESVINTAVKYDVVFSKYEVTKSDELAGAEIKITDADGNVVDQWTSSADGPHFLELETGNYTFEEVNAPAGFEKITTTVTFTVDTDGKVTLKEAYEDINGKVSVKDINHLILEDRRQLVDVTVSKEWLNASGWSVAAPSLWPAGAKVTVNIKDGDTVVKTVVLDADKQSETVTGLPKLVGREYTVEEAEVVGVYALEGNPEITTDKDGNVTAKLTNRLLPKRSELSLEIAKVDPSGKALKGAELEVTGVDFDGAKIDLGEQAVWTSDGTKHFIAHIVPGMYTLTEKKAPAGYKIAAPINFEVTLEGVVLVNGEVSDALVVTMVDELEEPREEEEPEETPIPIRTTTPTSTPTTPNSKPANELPNGGEDVEGTNPTLSPTNRAPIADVPLGKTPETTVRPLATNPLVRTGSPAGIAFLAAFGLMGAGVGLLIVRRRNA